MEAALSVIAAVIALGLVYVVAPVAIGAYRRYRGVQTVECPATGTAAEIELDAVKAAITATTGEPVVAVAHCSHWPERKDCGQECLARLDRSEGGGSAA
jgi:hypothetical protein